MDNVVKLVFNSVSTGGGLDDFVNRTKEGITNAGKLAQGVSILSQSFGTFGSVVGKALGMFIQGGVWGAAATGISTVIEFVRKWRDEAKLAAEENSRAFKEIFQKANEAASAMGDAYIKSNEAIDAAAKKKQEDIELTKKLTKAELELSEAKARSAGKTKEADELAKKALESETKAKEESAAVTVDAAKKKVEKAKKQAMFIPGWDEQGDSFKYDPKKWYKELRKRKGDIARIEQKINPKSESYLDSISNAKGFWGKTKAILGIADMSPEARKKEQAKSIEDPNYRRELKNELKTSKESFAKFTEQMAKARQAADNIAHSEKVLSDARKQEQAVVAENQKTIVVATANNLKAYRDEQIKNIQEDKAKKIAGKPKLESDRQLYKSQFEAAFDLWRDPEAAAAAVDADKKRSSDLKAFNKAVNRYGGKGKIDEYAALMRAGDEEGMQSRLDQWRKSSKFTPQVEQMVKAEAARQNENASERALANIEKNTANLDKKLDQLLSLK